MSLTSTLGLIDLKTTLLGVIVFLGLYWALRRKSYKNIPPGPMGWPLLGYLPKILLSSDVCVTLMKEAGTYGKVLSINLAGQLAVVLSCPDVVREAFTNPNISARPPIGHFIDNIVPGGKGVATCSGESWSVQRRFCLSALKGLGIGKSSFEENIATEASCVVKEMQCHKGAPFNPTHLLGNAVSNIICSVTFGKRFEYSDLRFQNLLALIGRVFELSGAGGPLLYLPIAKKLTFLPDYRKLIVCVGEIMGFVREEVESHRLDLDSDNPRDLVDHYLIEQRNLEKMNATSPINADNMLVTIYELFLAGTESTSTTLRWAILYMMAYPDIQSKIQREMDEVVGRNRLPRLTDRPNLPYTEATILELQRIMPIGPLPIPHCASQDTKVNGYDIPKDTLVMMNLLAIFRDESLWPEPYEFNPSRFIRDGKIVSPDAFLAFSTGRRVCLGENLARMELFSFFSYLLHQFTFKKPDDATPLSFKFIEGITRAPLPYETRAILRD